MLETDTAVFLHDRLVNRYRLQCSVTEVRIGQNINRGNSSCVLKITPVYSMSQCCMQDLKLQDQDETKTVESQDRDQDQDSGVPRPRPRHEVQDTSTLRLWGCSDECKLLCLY